MTLGAAEQVIPETVEAIREWNAAGRLPARIGTRRSLGDPVAVELSGSVVSGKRAVRLGRGAVAQTSRGIVWSGSVKVEKAYQLRLDLANVELPDDAVLWVYGHDKAIAFGKELVDSKGRLVTPSVFDETIHLEVEIAASEHASFTITGVWENFRFARARSGLKPISSDDPSCLLDATCTTDADFAPIEKIRKAVADMEWPDRTQQGQTIVCTGTLIADKQQSNTPYFLTANHCISNNDDARALELFWDFATTQCDGTAPEMSSATRTSGATLLATANWGTSSDYTLLRLDSIPDGRMFMGWDANATLPAGTRLFRVSHPAPGSEGPLPQRYSTTIVSGDPPNCEFRQEAGDRLVYSTNEKGGTYGGSSGSADMLENGNIVGTLTGGCESPGHDPQSGCDPLVLNADGRFSVTYQGIKQFIDNGTNSSSGQCTDSATVVCLQDNGTFAVHVDWKTNTDSGHATAIKYTPKSALFWFFGSDNIEMLVKLIDACPLGSTYWFFSAATTNVEYTIYVTSMKTGVTKTYHNDQGTLAAANADTNAFDRDSTCP